MFEEKISQEFRLKNVEEIQNYFIKETDQNELNPLKSPFEGIPVLGNII